MAEVGVINLTIHDNSEEAASGLGDLERALSAVKRKAQGYDLTNVQTQIENIVTAVKGSEATVKALGTLFNAIANYASIKMPKIDVKPIEELKTAVNGINIGNAGININKMREALEKEWNTESAYAANATLKVIAEGARDVNSAGLATTTRNIKNLTAELDKYVDSIKKVNNTPGAHDYLGQQVFAAVGSVSTTSIGSNVAKGIIQGVEEEKSAVIQSCIDMAKQMVSSMEGMLEISSPSRRFKEIGRYSMEGLKAGLEESESDVQRSAADIADRLAGSFSFVSRKIQKAVDTSAFQGVHKVLNDIGVSLESVGEKSIEGTAKIDLLKNKFALLQEHVGRLMKHLLEAGENPFENMGFLNAALEAMKLNDQIEKMTELNSKATKSNFGMDAVTSALGESKIDNMTAKYEAMISATAKAYDQGKLSEEKFISSILRIQELGDKIKKNGGVIDEYASAATQKINALFDSLERKVDYSYLSNIVDVITGAARKGMSAEEWGIDAFVTDASQKIGSLIEMLERPINYSNFREAIDFMFGIGQKKLSADEWGINAFVTEASKQIEALTNMLERPINYSGLKDFIDFSQHIGERKLSAEEWGIDAFVTDASRQIGSLIDMLEKPIDYSGLREFVDFMQGIGTRRMSAEEWGIDAFVTDASKQVESLMNYLEKPFNYKNLRDVVDEINGIGTAASSAKESMSVFLEAMHGDSELAENLRRDNSELALLSDTCRRAGVDFSDLEAVENTTIGTTFELAGAFSSLKSGIKAMFPTISGLLKRFQSIAKMRAIRYIIRQITAGISEGIKNVYFYSQSIGGSFAPAMDSAASALAQMKNSIGAALSPVIQALIPLLQKVVSIFIQLINYVNQFFALLRGQTTWTQAVEQTTSAYNDTANAANNAAKAAKDLLADWDELNIIQSESGGGGGGTTTASTPDYANMFQEVSEYADWIKQLVEGIKEQFGDVWNLAKRIALAILGWKVSSAFAGIIGILGGLVSAGALIGLIFDITTMFDKNYLKTGQEGWLIADVLTALIGSALMQKVLNNVLGAGNGWIGIPLVLAVSALANISTVLGATDVSALSPLALKLDLLAALKTGAAASYIGFKTGAGIVSSLAGGLATSLITFGAAVGIKAVMRSEHGEITKETLISSAISSLAMGVGVGMLAKLAGATALAATGFGLAASGITLLTLAAAIGIKAYLTSNKEDIAWGSLELTESQIKEFVEGEMFDANFSAKLELSKATVSASALTKASIQTQTASLFKTINILKLGVNSKDSIEEIKQQVFGSGEDDTGSLIGQFKKYAKEQTNLVETAITLVPIKDEKGTDQSASFAAKSIEGWDIITKAVEDLGTQLNQHLVASMNESLAPKLREYEKNAAAEIADTLARVTLAATSGQASGKAEVQFSLGLENLGRDSIVNATELYKQYIEDAKKEYIALTTEAAATYKSQAAMFAELALGAKDPETKKYYEDKAKEYSELFEQYKEKALHGVDDAIKGDKQKGHELFADWIKNTLQFGDEQFYKSIADSNGGAAQLVKQYMGSLGIALRNSEGEYTPEVKEELSRILETMLESVLPEEDYKAISGLISAGLVDYADIFDQSVIQNIIDYIGNDSYYGAAIRKAWDKLVFGGVGSENGGKAFTPEWITDACESAKTEVQATVDEINKTLEGVGSIYVEATVEDEIINALSNMNNGVTGRYEYDQTIAKLVQQYGSNTVQQILDKIGEEYGFDWRGNGSAPIQNANRTAINPLLLNAQGSIASTPDYNPMYRPTTTTEPEAGGIDYNQMANSMATAATSANQNVVSELQSIMMQLSRILNKDWTVVVKPSSDWGQHNQRSGNMWNRSSGENY